MPRRGKLSAAPGPNDGRITSVTDTDWAPILGPDGNPAPDVLRGAEKYGPRITAAEMERRVEVILGMLATGSRRTHILEFALGKTDWDVTRGTVDTYIKRATGRIREQGKRRARERIAEGVAGMREIMRLARNAGDYRAAILAQKEIDRLHGLGVEGQRKAPSDPPPTPTEPAPEILAGAGEQQRATRFLELLHIAVGRGAQLPPLPPLPADVIGNPN